MRKQIHLTAAVSTKNCLVTGCFASGGVVDISALHWANWPITKSLSVAVGDVEERVSETRVAKHSPPR